jgi:lactoylglutathione lyase
VEIVKRSEAHKVPNYFNFSQTMLRIKDPAKSIPFYEAFGMTVVRQVHFDDFSLFFLASSSNVDPDVDYSSLSSDEARAKLGMMLGPILELTHNHGTEADDNFKHYNGNEDGRQGFGHIGFLVDDVYAACDKIREMGYGFRKEPDGGSMKGLAFAYDPDGYSIEIIKRGGIEFGDKRVENP